MEIKVAKTTRTEIRVHRVKPFFGTPYTVVRKTTR